MTDTIRFRSDETGRHVRSKSPVDAPAQDPEIEKYDERRSADGDERRKASRADRPGGDGEPSTDGENRHEKRPEGPYKDLADERKQGDLK